MKTCFGDLYGEPLSLGLKLGLDLLLPVGEGMLLASLNASSACGVPGNPESLLSKVQEGGRGGTPKISLWSDAHYLPRAYAAGLSDWFCLSVVCRLSVHSKTGLSRDLQGLAIAKPDRTIESFLKNERM